MISKFSIRLLELFAGGAVVAFGVLLTAKAVPQAIATQPMEPAQTTPVLATPATPNFGFRGKRTQPEQHFIVMMIPHHDEAIAMANLALTRAKRPEVKTLARKIIQTQTQENHQMQTWYQAWYGNSVPTWQRGMGMGRSRMLAGRMPGLAGCMRSDLQSLENAPDFDRAFLEAMVPHHQMGVRMAQMVLARRDRPEIKALAAAIMQGQAAEIDQMYDWYHTWYPEGVAANY